MNALTNRSTEFYKIRGHFESFKIKMRDIHKCDTALYASHRNTYFNVQNDSIGSVRLLSVFALLFSSENIREKY